MDKKGAVSSDLGQHQTPVLTKHTRHVYRLLKIHRGTQNKTSEKTEKRANICD